MTARRLLDIKASYGPEAVVFSYATPSGSATYDFRDWLERLANAFGSPNVLTAIHICTWNRMYGAKYTYGVPMPGWPSPSPDDEYTHCMLFWGVNPQATAPSTALRISRARARGAKLIVIDPRQHSLAAKADCWLRVRPGSDGALAMIHVLLEEELYDAPFVRAWTNGPFLVREDTHQLLMAQDLAVSGTAGTFVVWDGRSGGPVGYHPDTGYTQDGVEPALVGTFALTLADGKTIACRPALELLKALAAQYAPERSEAITWVPADEVRRAVRLFATEKPSCYSTWVGLEQHSNAMQTNRAVCCFYALTGQFDHRGSNVLAALTPTNPIKGTELLPWEKAALRLGLAEHPLGPPADPGMVQAAPVYRAILSGQPYPVKALVLFGSDPLLGYGDPLQGKAALSALDFYVNVDLVANPSAAFADLLLPASTCWEGEALRPSFDGSAEVATWVQLRQAVVAPVAESRPDLQILFDLAGRLGLGAQFWDGDIEAALNYQLAPSGLSVQQLRAHPMGMRVEIPTRYQKYAEIHSHTAASAGIADGDWVVLETAMGRVRLRAKCNDALHPRVVATQYGWWQGCRELGLAGYDPFRPEEANVNLLIPNAAIDPISASVSHRSQMCRVRKEG